MFDLRNESLRAWLQGPYILGATGLGSPAVHGFYFDDGWNEDGPTEEDPHAVAACGLSPADVQDLIAAYQLSYEQKINSTLAAGGFVFDLFNSPSPPNATSAQPQCAPFLREHCGATSPSQLGPMLVQFSRISHKEPFPPPFPQQDLANFLLVRGPYGWLGYGWAGCWPATTYERPTGLDADYGMPLNFCTETAPTSGVFTCVAAGGRGGVCAGVRPPRLHQPPTSRSRRNYTNANVALDCNTFIAEISML